MIDAAPGKDINRYCNAFANFRIDSEGGNGAANQFRRQELYDFQKIGLSAAQRHQMIDQKKHMGTWLCSSQQRTLEKTLQRQLSTLTYVLISAT